MECFYGSLEGQMKSVKDKELNRRKGVAPEGAESCESFSTRVQGALNLALSSHGTVTPVAHRVVY